MKSVITLLLLLFAQFVFSQITFPVNGVANSYESTHAFINVRTKKMNTIRCCLDSLLFFRFRPCNGQKCDGNSH